MTSSTTIVTAALTTAALAVLSPVLGGCDIPCERVRRCGSPILAGGAGGTDGSGGGGGGTFSGGRLQWGVRFGDDSDQSAVSLATDAAGRTAVGANFLGSVTWGATTLSGSGNNTVLIALLDDGGQPLWARSFGSINQQRLRKVSMTDAGEVLIAGQFFGGLTIGGDTLQSSTDAIFIAKLSSSGEPQWARAIDGAGSQRLQALTIDPQSGTIAIAGSFTDELDDGAQIITALGGSDGFVTRLNQAGDTLSSRALAGVGNIVFSGATWADGSLFATGTFDGEVDFDGTTRVAKGQGDGFVMQLAADNTISWSLSFGDEAPQQPLAIAADAAGLVVAGTVEGSVDFGGGEVSVDTGQSAFIAAYDLAGAHRWQQLGLGGGSQQVSAVSLGADGAVYAVGDYDAAFGLDPSALPTSAAGARNGFVTKLSSSGEMRWLRTFGSGTTYASDVVASSALQLAGSSDAALSLDGETFATQGGSDGYVLQLSP